MIFSFDLDGTLIHSRRRLTETPDVLPVEYRQEEPFGFMTQGALDAFHALQQRTVCLVNTLRGLEQARRVTFVADGSCRYTAVQNGLYLYRDGVLDADWAARVARMVEELPVGLSDGVARVLSTLPGIECLSRQYEYMAVFFVTADFDDVLCALLAAELSRQGWALVRQRKKLYLHPLSVDKGSVLAHVQALEQDAEALGFGDSFFDLPMLRLCQRACAPGGCELEGGDWGLPLCFSQSPAQAGTEEVLRDILNLI